MYNLNSIIVWYAVKTCSFMLYIYNLMRKPSWRECRWPADFPNTWATGISQSWNSSNEELVPYLHM